MIKNAPSLELKKTAFAAAFLFLCWAPAVAKAAVSLYLFPPSGTYEVGRQFNVYVKIDPGGNDINAAEGVLVFNSKELEVVSVSKSDSFFTLWTAEPSFSNVSGKIEFGGGTQKPFSGSGGTVMAISLRGKTGVTTQVNFSSGSVLAADGMGTNLLSTMQGGNYTFAAKSPAPVIEPENETPLEPAQTETTEPQSQIGTPGKPEITSATHPDPEKWYKSDSVELSWVLENGIAGIQAALDQSVNSLPHFYYQSGTIKKNFTGLADGIWYFHLQFKNRAGWGSIAHRKIMIDGKPPEPFEIKIEENTDPANPAPKFIFETRDQTSGVAAYEIKIDQNELVKLAAESLDGGGWRGPALAPGKHIIIARALDRAENQTTAFAEFEILPMDCPVITEPPESIDQKHQLVFKGISIYPEAIAAITIMQGNQEIKTQEAKTDRSGDWVIDFGKDLNLKEGQYRAIAKIRGEQGGQSQNCSQVLFSVNQTFAAKIGSFLINYCAIIALLFLIIIAAILIFLWAWRKVLLWRDRIKRETDEADIAAKESFDALKKQNRQEIDYLSSLPEATPREKEIRQRLENALDSAQKYVSKEINDIEKEL